MKVQLDWMLVDEEIAVALNHKVRKCYQKKEQLPYYVSSQFICKAQVHKIVDWLLKPCEHKSIPLADISMNHGCRTVLMRSRRVDCPECMEQLKKWVGLE